MKAETCMVRCMDLNRLPSQIRDENPCRGCTERAPACHGSCGKYAMWRAELDRVNENRREYERKKAIRRGIF